MERRLGMGQVTLSYRPWILFRRLHLVLVAGLPLFTRLPVRCILINLYPASYVETDFQQDEAYEVERDIS